MKTVKNNIIPREEVVRNGKVLRSPPVFECLKAQQYQILSQYKYSSKHFYGACLGIGAQKLYVD